MNLREAIEARRRTVEIIHHPRFKERFKDWWTERFRRDWGRSNDEIPNAALGFKAWQAEGPLYFITNRVIDLIVAGAKGIPPTTVTDDLLPDRSGWFITETAVGVSEGMRLIGVLWTTDSQGFYFAGLYLKGEFLIPGTFRSFKFGSIATEDNCPLLALALFLRQKILVLSDIQYRPTNKSVLRKWRHLGWADELGVKIVQLRAKQYVPNQSGDEPMEWSCHWLVRGHWRQQYHPSTQMHEPLWILPHLKGDLERPFKAPAEVVYAVTR